MNALIATLFIAGAILAGVASAQAIPAAPLGQEAREANVIQVAKACKRGYQLTPRGCRRIKGR